MLAIAVATSKEATECTLISPLPDSTLGRDRGDYGGLTMLWDRVLLKQAQQRQSTYLMTIAVVSPNAASPNSRGNVEFTSAV
jgi:hypothetical protein